MTRALGIDIGTFAIKIAEIEYSGKSRDLVGLYDIPREAGDNPGLVLRDFLRSSGIKADRIAIGLGEAPVFVKRLELPFSDSKRYLPAVQSELEDSLPFELDDYILDVQKNGKSGRLTRFIVGLAPKAWVDRYNTIAESAEIIPNSFLLDSQSIGELALRQGLPLAHEETSYCVVDLGAQSTKIAIIRGFAKDPHDKNMKAPKIDGEVADFRTINHGSHELIQWIRDRKGIGADEAKQWLVHRAEIHVEDDNQSLAADLSDEIKIALRPIVVDIYQAIQAYKGVADLSIAAVYLTGGMSDIKGLREFLSDELRVSVHHWPIFMGYNTENVPLSPEKERSFAVALSLAHRFVLSKSSHWLNFRRSHSANRKVLSTLFINLGREEFKPAWLGLAGIFAFMLTYSFVALSFLEKERSELIKDAISEYRRVDPDAGKAAERRAKALPELRKAFDTKRQEKEKELKSRTVKKLGLSKSQMLLDLSMALPPSVKLSQFSSEGPDGPATQFEAVISLSKALSEDELDKLKATLEKPLKDRHYTVSIDKLPSGKELKLKGLSKGSKL